jgi:hypothetical protein
MDRSCFGDGILKDFKLQVASWFKKKIEIHIFRSAAKSFSSAG